MNYPKVLILGQTFNDFSGGGITLSNLFGDWPMDGLSVLSYPFMLHNSSIDRCQNYYQLGHAEVKWVFPFSLFKKKFSSGKVEIRNSGKIPVLRETEHVRHTISASIISPFLKWSGMIHCVSSIHLSQMVKDWISDFDPDILYIQISNRESIKFAIELIDYLEIPSVIHMMDDWPSTISSSGPFKGYWNRRIDREMKLLLDKTASHLSISQAMSDEYLSRYGKKFIPFHNPVAPEFISTHVPSYRPVGSHFRILYLGRVGRANKRSLRIFASFVSNYKPGNLAVELDIYTKDINNSYVRKLGGMERVKVRGPINHHEIQNYMSAYDLLLLPLDFTASALKFSRLSIPTKASEYMISGTPILVFAPPQTAISRFFSDNECGHCVISDDFQAINTAMNLLIHNDTYREELGKRAMHHASRLFDGIAIRRNFKELIISLLH